jgi:hypothetical protein
VAEKVFLHIGAPKSGTTYLQTVLWQNRKALRRAGVLVPGSSLFDMNRVAMAARRQTLGDSRTARTWNRMAEASKAWHATTVFSSEWICWTDEPLATRTVQQLRPDDVHVVFSARSFATLVPAAWQETLKRGAPHSLEEFVAALDAGQDRWSWWTLDPATVLARWEQAVGADHIHVVTLPPAGSPRSLLLERFAGLFGFDPSLCDTTTAQPNESLSVEAAELIRRVAPRAREEIDFENAHWSEDYRWLRRYLGHDLLVPQPGHRIRLPDRIAEELEGRAVESVSILRARGYDVAGDLDELVGQPQPADGRLPSEVTPEQMLDLAVPVMAKMLARVRDETLRAEAAEAQLVKED